MTLLEYLPDGYSNSPEVRAVVGGLDMAVAELWRQRDSFFDQLDLNKATWGLHWWEEAYGIEVDERKPLEFRRSRVVSKLRGQGTVTVAMIKSVAESFSNGAVDVLEDPANYHVDIKFVGSIGMPPNMEDLSATLEEILPAHLEYAYIIIFRTYGQLSTYTHGELAAYTHEVLRGGSMT